MCDPALTNYLVDLLVAFTHIDTLNAIRNARGKKLEQIAAMLLLLSDSRHQDRAERDQATYRKIGDFTLFWAGVYPEQLRRLSPTPTDTLRDYVSQGKESYAIVSSLVDETSAPPSSLFRHLADDFESCLFGLGLVRRGLEQANRANGSDGGPLVF